MKPTAGIVLLVMSVPQFEIQPFWPGGAVPGLPEGPVTLVQYSGVIPHWPQILQHAFNGHWFKFDRAVPFVGCFVPGTVGPHTALLTGLGIGGAPVLRQMLSCARRLPHPNQPHVVLLLKLSSLATVRLLASAIAEQLSSVFTVYYKENMRSAESSMGIKNAIECLRRNTIHRHSINRLASFLCGRGRV